MKFVHLPLLFLISVCTAHGDELERKLKLKRVYRRDAVLGSTFPENWQVTRRGVIEVAGREYFAKVHCGEYEGLIRLDAASDRPPKRIKLNESAFILFLRTP